MSASFQLRDLAGPLEAVRAEHAPEAVVVDAPDFETLPPAAAEELGLVVETISPASYPEAWLPADAPEALVRYAGDSFTIGMPGDGGVTWTTQTSPPVVLVKRRLASAPADFRDFLIAAALVAAGADLPEHFLPFFGDQYARLATVVPLAPDEVYQLAVACHEAYVGRHVKPVARTWEADERTAPLHAAWRDAGQRLESRLAGLAREVATGETSFAAAAELACGAIKHDVTVPTPFGALDTAAYREYGATYAVEWADRTFEELADADADADTDGTVDPADDR